MTKYEHLEKVTMSEKEYSLINMIMIYAIDNQLTFKNLENAVTEAKNIYLENAVLPPMKKAD